MKQYIKYTEYLRKEKLLSQLKENGFVFIVKKNKLKIVVGLICLGIAIFPNGLGIIFYPLSFMLLGINIIDLNIYKEKFLKKIKRLLR